MKRKKKRKKLLYIILLFIILISISIGVFCALKSNWNKNLIIKLNGKKNITIEYGDKYKDMGATASYKDTNLDKQIKITKNIDFNKLGKYYYKYTITYKNISKSVERKIEIKDTTKPEITLNGNDTINITVGDQYNDEGARATDNYDKDITKKIKTNGEVDTSKEGSYTITYSVKDSSNNENKITRTVNVSKKIQATISSNSNGSKKSSKGYKIEQKDGIYYVNGILIANKTYDLPSSYNPGDLLDIFKNNFSKMQSDAANSGINLKIISGFRSYYSQKTIYNNYVARDGQALADRYSARPGHSEHQTGLAADINSLDQDFEYTSEGKWLNNNCYKYGFIIRYVKGKENITGYMFEPWHIRYVGKDIATKLYNGGNWISLEEYLGITSTY